MSSFEQRETAGPAARVSLILPVAAGSTVVPGALAEYRQLLASGDAPGGVEVIIASDSQSASWSPEARGDRIIHVVAERGEWPALVHAGLGVAAGDHLVVLDVDRQYAPDSLARVIAPIRAGEFDLAVAVPRRDRDGLAGRLHPRCGLGLISRLFLGTSDVFSGLFAFERSLWDRPGRRVHNAQSSVVLHTLMLRRGPVRRCAGRRQRRFPFGTPRPGGPPTAQAPARRAIRQLFAAGPVLHRRRLGNGRRPVVLRPLSVATVVHVSDPKAIGLLRLHLAPGDCRRHLDRDRAGVELHAQPALDLQRRAQGIDIQAVRRLRV